MPRLKKPESEKKQNVTFMMNPEMVHLSKSVIVNIALSRYLKSKDTFRNNSKVKELLKDTDFYTIDD